jgi:hypothetical protein
MEGCTLDEALIESAARIAIEGANPLAQTAYKVTQLRALVRSQLQQRLQSRAR